VAVTPTDTQITEHNRTVMRRLLDMDEVAYALHVGRSTAFALVGSRQLRSIKIGNRRLVPADAIDELIETLQAGEPVRPYADEFRQRRPRPGRKEPQAKT
jgi:excisionase family DNA binding protein